MKHIPSLSTIADQYDAFILDLWGVIHDGRNLYPDVLQCLEALKAADKRVVFLSNAPRRAQVVVEALSSMGVTRDLYEEVMTSGEAAYRALEKIRRRPVGVCGNGTLVSKDSLPIRSFNYAYMGLERDRHILDGLECTEVENPVHAGFALVSHSYTDNQPLAELLPTLKTYLDARLTMLCINPDLEIVRLTGEHVYCAGLLAAEYERMGGAVVYFGKPHKAVYDACLETLHGIDKKRILAVGDSLLNDIKGGNAQGIDTVLVTGGILQAHIGTKAEGMLLEVVAKHAQAAEAQPDYVIERFVW